MSFQILLCFLVAIPSLTVGQQDYDERSQNKWWSDYSNLYDYDDDQLDRHMNLIITKNILPGDAPLPIDERLFYRRTSSEEFDFNPESLLPPAPPRRKTTPRKNVIPSSTLPPISDTPRPPRPSPQPSRRPIFRPSFTRPPPTLPPVDDSSAEEAGNDAEDDGLQVDLLQPAVLSDSQNVFVTRGTEAPKANLSPNRIPIGSNLPRHSPLPATPSASQSFSSPRVPPQRPSSLPPQRPSSLPPQRPSSLPPQRPSSLLPQQFSVSTPPSRTSPNPSFSSSFRPRAEASFRPEPNSLPAAQLPPNSAVFIPPGTSPQRQSSFTPSLLPINAPVARETIDPNEFFSQTPASVPATASSSPHVRRTQVLKRRFRPSPAPLLPEDAFPDNNGFEVQSHPPAEGRSLPPFEINSPLPFEGRSLPPSEGRSPAPSQNPSVPPFEDRSFAPVESRSLPPIERRPLQLTDVQSLPPSEDHPIPQPERRPLASFDNRSVQKIERRPVVSDVRSLPQSERRPSSSDARSPPFEATAAPVKRAKVRVSASPSATSQGPQPENFQLPKKKVIKHQTKFTENNFQSTPSFSPSQNTRILSHNNGFQSTPAFGPSKSRGSLRDNTFQSTPAFGPSSNPRGTQRDQSTPDFGPSVNIRSSPRNFQSTPPVGPSASSRSNNPRGFQSTPAFGPFEDLRSSPQGSSSFATPFSTPQPFITSGRLAEPQRISTFRPSLPPQLATSVQFQNKEKAQSFAPKKAGPSHANQPEPFIRRRPVIPSSTRSPILDEPSPSPDVEVRGRVRVPVTTTIPQLFLSTPSPNFNDEGPDARVSSNTEIISPADLREVARQHRSDHIAAAGSAPAPRITPTAEKLSTRFQRDETRRRNAILAAAYSSPDGLAAKPDGSFDFVQDVDDLFLLSKLSALGDNTLPKVTVSPQKQKISGHLQLNSSLYSWIPACAIAGVFFCRHKEDYPMDLVTRLTMEHEATLNKLFDEVHAVRKVTPLNDNDENNGGQFVCESQAEIVRPGWAQDATTGAWLVVVNTEAFPQHVRIESCTRQNEPCLFISPYYRSSCTQRHSFQRLVAINPEFPHEPPRVALFKMPCGCSCRVGTGHSQIRRDAH